MDSSMVGRLMDRLMDGYMDGCIDLSMDYDRWLDWRTDRWTDHRSTDQLMYKPGWMTDLRKELGGFHLRYLRWVFMEGCFLEFSPDERTLLWFQRWNAFAVGRRQMPLQPDAMGRLRDGQIRWFFLITVRSPKFHRGHEVGPIWLVIRWFPLQS
jgi:hypothetical protein